jgi:myo-inositol-1(or 4)-monophosphatase
VAAHTLTDALLCLQLPYNSDAYRPVIHQLIDTFYGRAASVRMMGSAAMALCYVAAGRLDGYVEKYIGRWDYMAGALIVQEAGGSVTDFEGQSDFTQGNSIVATNGVIHQDMLQPLSGRNNHF